MEEEEEEEGSDEEDVNKGGLRVKFDLGTTEDDGTCKDSVDESDQRDVVERQNGKIKSCDAFNLARKKAGSEHKRPKASEFSSEDADGADSENEDVSGEICKQSATSSKQHSSDDVTSDLADSLTPEERAFLGLTSGVAGGFDEEDEEEESSLAQKMTPVSQKNFKIFSSPQVLVVEADSEENIPTKKRKMSTAARLKRKLADKTDKKHHKTPRMTTNKKKTGSRYYETTNVKNKNRSNPT